MCNNNNIDDYWCPKPGENPDVMHIVMMYCMWGLPRMGLQCRNQARACNNGNMKNVSNERKRAASGVKDDQDVKRRSSTNT